MTICFGPEKAVPVTGAVTGSSAVAAPAAQTLMITDDEAVPTVTLALSPTSILKMGSPRGDRDADRSGDERADDADHPRRSGRSGGAGDFELSGNTELTIQAGQTTSTGLVTVSAPAV